jgi:hypothetical protein
MNGHELVSGWYHLALDPEASTVFRLKQRAISKSGHPGFAGQTSSFVLRSRANLPIY